MDEKDETKSPVSETTNATGEPPATTVETTPAMQESPAPPVTASGGLMAESAWRPGPKGVGATAKDSFVGEPPATKTPEHANPPVGPRGLGRPVDSI